MYDSGRLRSENATVPVISIGNISVGGTGKTPFTAWLAKKLESENQRPAILLRGYGEDEQLVHAHLNPTIPVFVDRDRVRGAGNAAHDQATVALLDDGFQHRRLARDADIVLISADRWRERMALLPAGEFREPLQSLSRATVIVVTRKSASREKALSVEKAIRNRFPKKPTCIALLSLAGLRDKSGIELPLAVLAGRTVLAISAVGDNIAFESQLKDLNAVLRFRAFGDHHAFSPAEISELTYESANVDFTVCTLKDAVKLWPGWPATAKPLWYVSQTLVLESGAGALDELVAKVTASRPDKP